MNIENANWLIHTAASEKTSEGCSVCVTYYTYYTCGWQSWFIVVLFSVSAASCTATVVTAQFIRNSVFTLNKDQV